MGGGLSGEAVAETGGEDMAGSKEMDEGEIMKLGVTLG